MQVETRPPFQPVAQSNTLVVLRQHFLPSHLPTMAISALGRVRVHLGMIFGSHVECRLLSSEMVLRGLGFEVMVAVEFK
jgi:hypothetical protein